MGKRCNIYSRKMKVDNKKLFIVIQPWSTFEKAIGSLLFKAAQSKITPALARGVFTIHQEFVAHQHQIIIFYNIVQGHPANLCQNHPVEQSGSYLSATHSGSRYFRKGGLYTICAAPPSYTRPAAKWLASMRMSTSRCHGHIGIMIA